MTNDNDWYTGFFGMLNQQTSAVADLSDGAGSGGVVRAVDRLYRIDNDDIGLVVLRSGDLIDATAFEQLNVVKVYLGSNAL